MAISEKKALTQTVIVGAVIWWLCQQKACECPEKKNTQLRLLKGGGAKGLYRPQPVYARGWSLRRDPWAERARMGGISGGRGTPADYPDPGERVDHTPGRVDCLPPQPIPFRDGPARGCFASPVLPPTIPPNFSMVPWPPPPGAYAWSLAKP